MIPLIECHRESVADLCRRYSVRRMEVFGSAAERTSNEDARDVDLLVDFEASSEMGPADQYFGLLADLETLLDRPVDLVCVKAMRNPWFIQEVNRSRNLLYAA